MPKDALQLIENFQDIALKKPVDIIIGQIQHLVTSGVLKPGDRLPSERALSEKFAVGRGYVREAIKKLEFYGTLRTLPQRATYVATPWRLCSMWIWKQTCVGFRSWIELTTTASVQ